MKLNVTSQTGHKGSLEPQTFILDGHPHTVLGVSDRWHDPDVSYFKVRADDGHRYLLGHDHRDDTWSLVKVFNAHS